MYSKIYMFTASLSLALIMLLISGCVPIIIPHSVPAETVDIDYPEHYFSRITVAPSFHLDEVSKFTSSASKADEAIEIVTASDVFLHAFPNGGPDIEVTVGKLLQPEVRSRIRDFGVRYIVILSPYQTTSETTSEIGTFMLAAGSGTDSTKLLASLVDLEQPLSRKFLEAHAEGSGAAVWFGLYIIGNYPRTEKSAIAKMADVVISEIQQSAPEQHVKITVLAGEWESGELYYKEEQALKVFQERAKQGDPDAQWQLYKLRKSRGEYDFDLLCKAAEQGDYRAQWELGYLHLHGLYGVRKDLVISVMWYNLVEAGGHDPTSIQNIRNQLSSEQLNKAEHLYESWSPGRCEQEIIGAEPKNTN